MPVQKRKKRDVLRSSVLTASVESRASSSPSSNLRMTYDKHHGVFESEHHAKHSTSPKRSGMPFTLHRCVGLQEQCSDRFLAYPLAPGHERNSMGTDPLCTNTDKTIRTIVLQCTEQHVECHGEGLWVCLARVCLEDLPELKLGLRQATCHTCHTQPACDARAAS